MEESRNDCIANSAEKNYMYGFNMFFMWLLTTSKTHAEKTEHQEEKA